MAGPAFYIILTLFTYTYSPSPILTDPHKSLPDYLTYFTTYFPRRSTCPGSSLSPSSPSTATSLASFTSSSSSSSSSLSPSSSSSFPHHHLHSFRPPILPLPHLISPHLSITKARLAIVVGPAQVSPIPLLLPFPLLVLSTSLISSSPKLLSLSPLSPLLAATPRAPAAMGDPK